LIEDEELKKNNAAVRAHHGNCSLRERRADRSDLF
jgi:hypothetical protein